MVAIHYYFINKASELSHLLRRMSRWVVCAISCSASSQNSLLRRALPYEYIRQFLKFFAAEVRWWYRNRAMPFIQRYSRQQLLWIRAASLIAMAWDEDYAQHERCLTFHLSPCRPMQIARRILMQAAFMKLICCQHEYCDTSHHAIKWYDVSYAMAGVGADVWSPWHDIRRRLLDAAAAASQIDALLVKAFSPAISCSVCFARLTIDTLSLVSRLYFVRAQ